jgi:hypothetical protein
VIDYAIRTRLAAVTAVTDLVGGTTTPRIWAFEMPQVENPVWPCITYQIVSGSPEYHIDGAAGVATVRIQIDCWSAKRPKVDAYAEVRNLAEAVRGALSAYTGTVGTDVIQSSFLMQRRTTYEEDAEVYRESMDFEVGYTEA